ncbi:hypothetical protein JG688_00015205 [Phytophthora aleatoria]|uniref:Uncharacterized protein n=1 Tax=Phytophthora aleatoria TaxID=2496075 RepID=A0A8J5IKA4_9STRA|nr:hypothetical protein JG688_00015205 [Phytophthora aleatoria]
MERTGSFVYKADQQCGTKEARAAWPCYLCFADFVYVPRPRAQRLTSLRRATDARIQEQLSRLAEYMRER